MQKRSKLLLASWIIGALYLVYILTYFFSKNYNAANAAESFGSGLATILVAPHIFFVLLALIFNIIGWATSKPWSVLTGAILYSVAAFMFLLYIIFVLPSIILSFVGYAMMKKGDAKPTKYQAHMVPNQATPESQIVSGYEPESIPSRPALYQAKEKDWVDKIEPALPLVYVVWFCGIAVGTFSLLYLIFA